MKVYGIIIVANNSLNVINIIQTIRLYSGERGVAGGVIGSQIMMITAVVSVII